LEKQKPVVLLLDGMFPHAVQIARELTEDLDVEIVAAGPAANRGTLATSYCRSTEIVPPVGDAGYAEAILGVARRLRPDVILPVGYRSVSALVSIRGALPTECGTLLPDADALAIALDKRATLSLASSLGVDVPLEYSGRLLGSSASELARSAESLPYPVFLKASKEAGINITALVGSPPEFLTQFQRLRAMAEGADVLVQEFVDGDATTYGCGALWSEGRPVLMFGHHEIRSVPRSGGSATRVNLSLDTDVERYATRMLGGLKWNGVALVEFKRRSDGTLVLMEINPKFWASYALASRTGYRFASHLVKTVIPSVQLREVRRRKKASMVFPMREFIFYWKHRREKGESLISSLSEMSWPPAMLDLRLRDYVSLYLPRRGSGARVT
jgi:predicted ATP-grasp superfamily ATP-dependent carboligase